MDDWNILGVYDGSKMKQGKEFKGHIIEDIALIGKVVDKIDTLIVMIPSEDEDKLESIVRNNGYLGKILHVGKYKFYREEL